MMNPRSFKAYDPGVFPILVPVFMCSAASSVDFKKLGFGLLAHSFVFLVLTLIFLQ